MQSWSPAPVETPGGGINLGRYVSALRRYKWLILLITLLGAAGGVAATRFIKPTYNVQATLWISPTGGRTGPIRAPELLEVSAYAELLKSYAILDPVVTELALYLTPDERADRPLFNGFVPASELRPGSYELRVDESGRNYALFDVERSVEVERGAVGDSVGRRVGFLWQPPASEMRRGRTARFNVVTPREAAVELRDAIQLRVPRGSNFLLLSMSGGDARIAASTMNRVLDRFVAAAEVLKKRSLAEVSNTLSEQLEAAQITLRNAELALQGHKTSTITLPSEVAVVPGSSISTSPAISDFFQKKVQYDDIRQNRQAVEKLLGESRSSRITPEALYAVPRVLESAPELSTALQDLERRRAQLRTLKETFTDEYKPVKDLQARIDEMEQKTLPEITQRALVQIRTQEQDIQRRIAGAEVEIGRIPARTVEEARLTREVAVADNLYTQLKIRYQEAQLAEASAVNEVSVLDSAVAPRFPSANKASMLVLAAILGSFGAAVVLAFLLDHLDKRFRYPEQATKDLRLDIIGGVPTIRRTKNGVTRLEDAAQIVEAFRALRLNVRNAFEDGEPVSLTVSSPGPGDGKSLLSSNLALVFAESGYRTLLIDGDIRRGQLHTMFNVPQRPGLLDVLTGEVPVDSVLHQTAHQNLWLLPCGTRRHRGPELLAADGTARLIRSLRSQYDAIIVDSAPLGAGIDSFALGAATGNMLLVLRTGRTDRKLAKAKLSTLDRLPVRVLGAVLNDIKPSGAFEYYSYLDGYGTVNDEPMEQLAAGGEPTASR